MSTVTFVSDALLVNGPPDVEYMDFGIPGAIQAKNGAQTAQVSGPVPTVVVYYNSTGVHTSQTFNAKAGVTFATDANITISGGGSSDSVVSAQDANGNTATWVLVGGEDAK